MLIFKIFRSRLRLNSQNFFLNTSGQDFSRNVSEDNCIGGERIGDAPLTQTTTTTATTASTGEDEESPIRRLAEAQNKYGKIFKIKNNDGLFSLFQVLNPPNLEQPSPNLNIPEANFEMEEEDEVVDDPFTPADQIIRQSQKEPDPDELAFGLHNNEERRTTTRPAGSWQNGIEWTGNRANLEENEETEGNGNGTERRPRAHSDSTGPWKWIWRQ
jgi:hypothetical protein